MVARRLRHALLAFGLLLSSAALLSPSALAQDAPAIDAPGEAIVDPLDPFDFFGTEEIVSSADDDTKSADDLIRDGILLLQLDRPLDARTKLLKALKKDPENYRTYNLLAAYYLIHVGHYRLALKYIKRAEELFEKSYGKPPYANRELRKEHSDMLYYLSQVRLNLDNYQGALDVLDRFTSLGYTADWYPGSRAWILMKLGNIQEAIRVARVGVLIGDDGARTLNMLGILLSMNDQPQEALEVFRQAIAFELSLGNEGQPGTPLNNSGEVYEELFEDEKAESSFLRATSYKDGCEHILPSLNLSLMYVDQLRFHDAAAAMDGFDRCMAQYPLKNNEEHVALESLARGRIDLHTGRVDRAIKRFEAALEGTQWFGKIGTNQNDLVVAGLISLSQALTARNNILRTTVPLSWGEWYRAKEEIASNSLRAWWLMRRARQMLIGELNKIEDLTVRNTDSLVEYPTLGDALSGLSNAALEARLAQQLKVDHRPVAQTYYKAYAAQGQLGWFGNSGPNSDLDDVIDTARPRLDELLKTHAMLLRMESLSQSGERYRELAYRVFYTVPAELRNRGFKLPVTIEAAGMPSGLASLLADGPFLPVKQGSGLCVIRSLPSSESPAEIKLSFSCPGNPSKDRIVGDVEAGAVVNKLSDALFREEVPNGSDS